MKRSPMPVRKAPMRRSELRRRTASPRYGPGTPDGAAAPAGGNVNEPTSRLRVSRGHRVPVDVRRIVAQRSGGWCEIQAQGCWGKATQIHHRVTQKMGGRHREGAVRSDRPSDLLHVDTWCHLLAGDDNSRYVKGWCLREHEDPTAEPLVYRGRVVYLDDAGAVHSHEEARP